MPRFAAVHLAVAIGSGQRADYGVSFQSFDWSESSSADGEAFGWKVLTADWPGEPSRESGAERLLEFGDVAWPCVPGQDAHCIHGALDVPGRGKVLQHRRH